MRRRIEKFFYITFEAFVLMLCIAFWIGLIVLLIFLGHEIISLAVTQQPVVSEKGGMASE